MLLNDCCCIMQLYSLQMLFATTTSYIFHVLMWKCLFLLKLLLRPLAFQLHLYLLGVMIYMYKGMSVKWKIIEFVNFVFPIAK